MAVNDALRKEISNEMNNLDPKDYLGPGMSYNDFVEEYSEILGQAKEDKTNLINAFFNWELIKKYRGYLELLTLEHAERITDGNEKSNVEEDFKKRMPVAEKDRKILSFVARFIIIRTGSPSDKKIYDHIRDGYGDVDCLNDNIAYVSFINNNTDVAQKVRPGGKVIDDKYLNQVKNEALKLLQLKGHVTAAADDKNSHVIEQNKLITLCVIAKREIKLFAEMAFIDNPDHYNNFYASDNLRANRKKRKLEQKEDEPSVTSE